MMREMTEEEEEKEREREREREREGERGGHAAVCQSQAPSLGRGIIHVFMNID